MQKDWIFEGDITSQQKIGLSILFDAAGVSISMYLSKSLIGEYEFIGIFYSSIMSDIITAPIDYIKSSYTPSNLKKIFYKELISMLEEEIRTKTQKS